MTQKQELHPKPQLCLSYLSKLVTGTNLTNITQRQYRDGHWNINGFNEENSFDEIAPKFKDLVKSFTIQRTVSSGKVGWKTEIYELIKL